MKSTGVILFVKSIVLCIVFCSISVYGQNVNKLITKAQKISEVDFIKPTTGEEDIDISNGIPFSPGTITISPGTIVGTTYYDVQSNGSSGNRIVICNDGSKYFCWMNLLGWPYPPVPRFIYHNWMDIDGNLNPNGFVGQVSYDVGGGYTNMDLIYDNRGVIAYHSAGGSTPTYVTASVDWDPPGMGYFNHYDPPDEIFPQNPDSPGRLYWPYIAVNNNDNIHIMATESTAYRLQRMCYCNSTNGGITWSALQLVDTVMVISSVIDASPVSDKMAIAYSKAQDTTSQWKNDIVYVVSEDGLTWDFINDRINVTNYDNDHDSLWAYADLDIIIDYNDNIHLVWNAQWITDQGLYYRTYLFHYSEATGEINEILYHPDSLWMNCSGAWNRPICKMNMGIYDRDAHYDGIFVAWTQFDTSDVSAGGYCNGEIYISYSIDDGASWSDPENLTNSPTPGCYPGQCDSDHWSTLADVIDDSLHILYINDRDAGGVPYQYQEGSATENPVMYLAIPNPLYELPEEAGSIAGVVSETDETTPIEGVLVKALQEGSEMTSDYTEANGSYILPYLAPGLYDVEASIEGYLDQTVSDIEVFAHDTTIVNFQLQPQMQSFDLISPENGSILESAQPTVIWHSTTYSSSNLPIYYKVYWDEDENFASADSSSELLDTTYTFIDSLSRSQAYYWRVLAYDNYAVPRYSNQIWNFYINGFPEETTILAPENGTSADSLTYLIWLQVNDPDSFDVVSYSLQVDDENLFTSPEIYEIGIPGSDLTMDEAIAVQLGQLDGFTNLNPDTRYYWRVRCDDLYGGNSNWTDGSNYFIYLYSGQNTGPEPFPLYAPPDNHRRVDFYTYFIWGSSYNPYFYFDYTIQYCLDSLFSGVVMSISGLTDTSLAIPTDVLSPSGQILYWRILAIDDDGLERIGGIPEPEVRRLNILPAGDANGDGLLLSADATYLVGYFIGNNPAPDPPLAGDANGDCLLIGGDVTYLVQYFIGAGSRPVRGNCEEPVVIDKN